MVVARNGLHQDVRQLGVYVCPDVDYLVVTLVVGDETHVIVVDYLLHLFVTSLHQRFLLLRDDDVTQVERKTALEAIW